MSGTAIESRAGGIATITIANEAKRNALDPGVMEAIAAAAERLAEDAAVRVVVLRGAGDKAFSAGADFAAFDTVDETAFSASLARMSAALERSAAALVSLPQPVIAVIDGPCFGGAVQLALAADFRLAGRRARLSIPAARLGLVYATEGIDRLRQLMGPGRARLVLMTGRSWTAEDAFRDGLVDLLAEDGALEAGLDRLCADLVAAPASTLTAYKRILDGLAAGKSAASLAAIETAAHADGETWRRLSIRRGAP